MPVEITGNGYSELRIWILPAVFLGQIKKSYANYLLAASIGTRSPLGNQSIKSAIKRL
jgi:hypothetical protein